MHKENEVCSDNKLWLVYSEPMLGVQCLGVLHSKSMGCHYRGCHKFFEASVTIAVTIE